ncbi:uncharacterized protein LOC130628583 [Hydractinia symbiolongicarpus]|uniref:uncharacterized protein LOC130628583 n=1 Tax=Hydractinia symbiolongicarpus TaxID=13093 RepID=UPI0025500E6B|nr:uncharacterized protein LOC130628583 [Hydractinia symbiolongicarpus]
MKTKKLKRDENRSGDRLSTSPHNSNRTIIPPVNRHFLKVHKRRIERGSLFETVYKARHLISVSINNSKCKTKSQSIALPRKAITKSQKENKESQNSNPLKKKKKPQSHLKRINVSSVKKKLPGSLSKREYAKKVCKAVLSNTSGKRSLRLKLKMERCSRKQNYETRCKSKVDLLKNNKDCMYNLRNQIQECVHSSPFKQNLEISNISPEDHHCIDNSDRELIVPRTCDFGVLKCENNDASCSTSIIKEVIIGDKDDKKSKTQSSLILLRNKGNVQNIIPNLFSTSVKQKSYFHVEPKKSHEESDHLPEGSPVLSSKKRYTHIKDGYFFDNSLHGHSGDFNTSPPKAKSSDEQNYFYSLCDPMLTSAVDDCEQEKETYIQKTHLQQNIPSFYQTGNMTTDLNVTKTDVRKNEQEGIRHFAEEVHSGNQREFKTAPKCTSDTEPSHDISPKAPIVNLPQMMEIQQEIRNVTEVLTNDEDTTPYEDLDFSQDSKLDSNHISFSNMLKEALNEQIVDPEKKADIKTDMIIQTYMCDHPQNDGHLKNEKHRAKRITMYKRKRTKPNVNIDNYKFIIEKGCRKVISVKRKKTFSTGDIVVGKFKHMGWWFGEIIEHTEKPLKGHHFVFWYGDHHILQIPTKYLDVYTNFSKVFSKPKLAKRKYEVATMEFLEEIYKKLNIIDIHKVIEDEINHSRFHILLAWGLASFPVVEKSSLKNNLCVMFQNNPTEKKGNYTHMESNDKIEERKKTETDNPEKERVDTNEISNMKVLGVPSNSVHPTRNVHDKELSKKKQEKGTPEIKQDTLIKTSSLIGSTQEKTIVQTTFKVTREEKENISGKADFGHSSEINQNLTLKQNFFSDPPTRRSFAKAIDHFANRKKPVLEYTILNRTDGTNVVECKENILSNLNSNEKNLSSDNSVNNPKDPKEITVTSYADVVTPRIITNASVDRASMSDKSIEHEDSCSDDSGIIDISLSKSDLSYESSSLSHSGSNADVSELYSSVDESISSPKRKTKDGITLDFDLLFTHASKRQCFISAEKKFTSPKRKQSESDGKLKRKQRVKVSAHSSPSLDVEIKERMKAFGSWTKSIVTSKVLEHSSDDSSKRKIRVGDLVLGKLKGFDWWFGKVITFRKAKESPPSEGCSWVYWYGDHKKSEMLTDRLESLSLFPLRFAPKKMKGLYRKAVEEMLTEAAFRCSKDDLPLDDDKRLQCLVDWALTGFKPMGVNALYSVVEDTEGSHSLEQKSNIESSRELESGEGALLKDRVGQILQSPILSDGIKALFDRVHKGNYDIENLCLGCGDTKVITQHPLFEGGLCKECKDSFIEHAYLYDDDGSQMYCTICSDGEQVILCDKVGCCRSYCPVCIDMLCGAGYAEKLSKEDSWECFMCSGKPMRILRRRDDWQKKLKDLFQDEMGSEDYGTMTFYDPIPIEERKAIRVLALFDGIGTGFHVLKELDFDVELYIASEIDENAKTVTLVHYGDKIRHVGDVCKIREEDIKEWGPFDLVIGGSPCNDLSIANPLRKGIYDGTGRLFFEFYRILQYAKPHPIESRPFFWLFENVVGMQHVDREVINRFLKCHPVVVSAKDVSAQHRTRFFWGNLPGMNRSLRPIPTDKVLLQDCLEPGCGRVAKVDKVRCITTMRHSLRQTKKSILPVKLTRSVNDEIEDGLWLTEIERIFGFPDHYTDVCNMGQRQRQKLLGKAWSVPVIRHLFTPLKDYFRTNSSPEKTADV